MTESILSVSGSINIASKSGCHVPGIMVESVGTGIIQNGSIINTVAKLYFK